MAEHTSVVFFFLHCHVGSGKGWKKTGEMERRQGHINDKKKSQLRRSPRVAKNKSERVGRTEEKGKKSPEGKMCSPKAVEGEVGVGLSGAGARGGGDGGINI